jgi:mannose-6-phosphate isomerase-like protein (cupin superfamily)
MLNKLTVADGISALSHASATFARLFEKPTFDVGLYKPTSDDLQGPHSRDELYFIATGSGEFICNGHKGRFQSGDVFFVPAGAEHSFTRFSLGFSTWVIFLGPRMGD